MESVSVQTADETPENVAKGLLNTFKNSSFELCLLASENLFKVLNRALDELQGEKLKLSHALESISSDISLWEKFNLTENTRSQKETGSLAKMLAWEIRRKAVQTRWCHHRQKTRVTEQNVIRASEYFIITTTGP